METDSYKGSLWFYFGNKICDSFAIGTVPYYVKFILGRESSDITLLLAMFILAQLFAVPIWTKIAKKVGFRKTMIYAGFCQAFLTLPLFFIREFTVAIPFFFIAGFGNGGMWTMLAPIFSEVLDELSLKTGKRDSGVFVGINTFFGRFSIIFFTVFTVLVHWLTGFNADAGIGTNTQTELAKNGILFLLVGIPVIFLAFAIFMFKRLYDIKGEKKEEIERKKKELGI